MDAFLTEGSSKGLKFVTGCIFEWSLSVDNPATALIPVLIVRS